LTTIDYKNLLDFSGKVALVSGASRGIGEAIAHGLAANGAHVIVSSRRLEPCEKVAEDIRAAGGEASARACHQGKLEDISTLFDDISSMSHPSTVARRARCAACTP